MDNRFENNPKPDWKIAILCFRDYIGCEVIINSFNATPVRGYKVFYGIDSHESKRQVFEAEISGQKIGIITRLSWGGPQAAILVEELSYLGVAYILGYGGAGSIDGDIYKGDLVVGTRSIVSDGTSRVYTPDKQELLCNNEMLLFVMEEAHHQLDLKAVTVANVDALYRETKELIRKYQSHGAQIVNMETSALYASAEICNVKSIWLGFISDSLVSDNWDNWNMDSRQLSLIISTLCVRTVERILKKVVIEG